MITEAALLYLPGWFATATFAARKEVRTVNLCVPNCTYRPSGEYESGRPHISGNCTKKLVPAELAFACFVALVWPIAMLVYGVKFSAGVGKKAPLYTPGELDALEKELLSLDSAPDDILYGGVNMASDPVYWWQCGSCGEQRKDGDKNALVVQSKNHKCPEKKSTAVGEVELYNATCGKCSTSYPSTINKSDADLRLTAHSCSDFTYTINCADCGGSFKTSTQRNSRLLFGFHDCSKDAA